ncbi:hypothetical protein [Clostridium tertium]|uniref:hypothetical protein n=1 Tax=Clostridium tertium TaxID=1559 RepID=UPI001AE44D75|nr:hypothetical protein [Clostridium tertium]MBP1869004.1 DNA replicative helicase MCM subunit Mcm2 (Cdc46/Mcm family) [Clostridium tertium]
MITKNIKTYCDLCKKSFKIKAKMLKETKVTNEVTKLSFKCPHCKHEFVVIYKDNEVEENIKIMNDIAEEIKNKDKFEPMELDTLTERFNKLKHRNLELSSSYKVLYGR